MRKILVVLAFLLITGLVGLGFLGVSYTNGLQAVGGSSEPNVITIEPGDSAAAIGDKLEAAGLLRSRTSYDVYVRLNDVSARLRQGSYIFTAEQSAVEMIDAMTEGDVATRLITVRPGLRLDQIRADMIDRAEFDGDNFDTAIASAESLIAFDNNGTELRLEGLLMPETYTIGLNDGVDEVVKQSVELLERNITQEMIDSFAARDLTVQDAVILASIVQGEAANPDQQRKIAGVFLNRLEIGMSLGADPTFRYASWLEGLEFDRVDVQNPYNTRIYSGLPPGPISNFNLSAIEAVANPEESSFLFFVAGDDGTIYYNETLDGHNRDADTYCIELCKL